MPDSYTNLLYHIVFSTKDRRPLITPDYELRLYDYIGGTLRQLGGISLELNGTEKHIHLLTKLRPDRAVSEVLRELKSNATAWMHDVFPNLREFSWQRGYGAFTVSQSRVESVRKYIAGQKERHQKISFAMNSFSSCERMESNLTRDLFHDSAVARSAGSVNRFHLDPGACAPGFMLSPAPRAGLFSPVINPLRPPISPPTDICPRKLYNQNHTTPEYPSNDLEMELSTCPASRLIVISA